MYLTPVAMYKDPFRLGNNKLVLCETYKHNKLPADTNKRKSCNEAMERLVLKQKTTEVKNSIRAML